MATHTQILSTFELLPPELKVNIIENLKPESLFSLCDTSSTFREICKDDYIRGKIAKSIQNSIPKPNKTAYLIFSEDVIDFTNKNKSDLKNLPHRIQTILEKTSYSNELLGKLWNEEMTDKEKEIYEEIYRKEKARYQMEREKWEISKNSYRKIIKKLNLKDLLNSKTIKWLK